MTIHLKVEQKCIKNLRIRGKKMKRKRNKTLLRFLMSINLKSLDHQRSIIRMARLDNVIKATILLNSGKKTSKI